MKKVTIEFFIKDNDDLEDAKRALDANNLYVCIEDIQNRLRQWRKYEDYAEPEKLDDDIIQIINEYVR